MSDLISRSKLFANIKGVEVAWYLDGNHTTYDDTTIMDIIEEQPSMEFQTWIPCSERLPEENRDGWTELLLSIKTGEVILGFWHDTETGFCRRFRDGVCSAGGVVAWMPLPPAFKGE